ncbi:MAG: endonuclease domain-containing protein [candidate division Zixibacteria bacterium]|nr:endonuclease domain-containing protein [candidate division Zixibacteria bacterium]
MAKLFNNQKFKYRRQLLRNNATRAEQLLWNKLKRRRLNGLKFRRQYSIGQYIVDFYLPSHKLAIEIDGPTHLSNQSILKDKTRTRFLKNNGISLLRYGNNEIYEGMENVLQSICEFLITTPQPPP